MNVYAAYRGDEFIDLGTIKQLGKKLEVKEETVRFYSTKAYRKRIESRKNPKNYIIVIKLEK